MAAKQDYIRSLNTIIKRFDNLEEQTVKDMLGLLNSFRKEVIDMLAGLPADDAFNTFRLSQLRDGLEDLISVLEPQMIRLSGQSIVNASELGLQAVTDPLKAAGITTFYNRPNLAQINTMIDFSADLIRGITAEIRKAINTQISRVALGGISPFQAQRTVNDIMGLTARGPGKEVVRGIGYNAERIVRTETNRAYNVSNMAQMEEIKRVTPDAMKRWNASGDMRTRNAHILAHGQVVPIDKPFIVGGEKMMYPLDPAGSAANTINCRCRMTVVHPEIGVVGGPLDGQIARELKRREELGT